MTPEAWKNISAIALIAGIVFLILTVVLSVKFDLIMIIKTEINTRKANKEADSEEYFAYVENRSAAEDEEPAVRTVSRGNEEIRDVNEPREIRIMPIAESGLGGGTIPTGYVPPTPSEVREPVKQSASPISRPSSGTVMVSRKPAQPERADTVLSSKNSEPKSFTVVKDKPVIQDNAPSAEEFTIIENIIIIHGDPSAVPRTELP